MQNLEITVLTQFQYRFMDQLQGNTPCYHWLPVVSTMYIKQTKGDRLR